MFRELVWKRAESDDDDGDGEQEDEDLSANDEDFVDAKSGAQRVASEDDRHEEADKDDCEQ